MDDGYKELVEGTYVEPGHDVAPNAWVADGSPTRQKPVYVKPKKTTKLPKMGSLALRA